MGARTKDCERDAPSEPSIVGVTFPWCNRLRYVSCNARSSCSWWRPPPPGRNGREEEEEPSLEVSRLADVQEVVDVVGAMLQKVLAQVQERMRQFAAFTEVERDEQTSDASVAVKERMDGFKLPVEEGDVEQGRQRVLFVQELLPTGEQLPQFPGRRRDVAAGSRGAAWRTDPVFGSGGCLREPLRSRVRPS